MDLSKDPHFLEWARDVRANVLPKLSESVLSLMAIPDGDVDIDFAVQLGMSILMDKPIIAVVSPGMKVPAKLAQIADRIVEADPNSDPAEAERIQAAITAALEEIEKEQANDQ